MPRWTGDPEARHLSVSQLQQYERCPYSYYLARIVEPAVPRRPAAWLPMGTALHEAVDRIEKDHLSLDEAVSVYEETFIEGINKITEKGWMFSDWFASGRYQGAQDAERRFNLGREHLERYYEYRVEVDEQIWTTPDGVLAAELPFDIDLDGIRILGYIDQVIELSSGRLHVRDVKSGASPSDDLQLGVYKVALQEMYPGVEVESGDYFMTKTGKATFPYSLEEYTYESVTTMFKELDRNIKAGRFDARPDPSVCRRCDVAASCEYAV